jgi:hypothetical protein
MQWISYFKSSLKLRVAVDSFVTVHSRESSTHSNKAEARSRSLHSDDEKEDVMSTLHWTPSGGEEITLQIAYKSRRLGILDCRSYFGTIAEDMKALKWEKFLSW